MNQKIIAEDNIKFKAVVSDWKNAMEQSAQMLIDSNYITKDYLDSAIKVVKSFGPYIVISQGIALSHARPSSSVLKTGISLLTLSTPVNFNSKNDPVDIIVTAAATDLDVHLELLEKLSIFLSNIDNMNYIRNCIEPLKLAEKFNSI